MSTVPIESVRFVKELYPRLREDDETIERYRAALDLLPPIAIARDGIIVDGYHRWQAHRREKASQIAAINLGNLADIEILKESIRRNASHGHQLRSSDKKRLADQLYRTGTRDLDELVALLSITRETLDTYLRDAKRDEKAALKAKAWDLWLDCYSEREIAEKVGVDQATINRWISDAKTDRSVFASPPASRQHFDIWSFGDGGDGGFFGRMPPAVVENLLWFYTEPGDIVVDPFAGSGTTIDVCKAMGRRIWASDLTPNAPLLPIHQHDITLGWPDEAPRKAKLLLLDPPYWQQAKGKYSDSPADLSNLSLSDFYGRWGDIAGVCTPHAERIAYLISPTQCNDGGAIDHAIDMLSPFWAREWRVERRIIVPYQTQQATGQQVTWARENKKMLKLYRDLVVLSR